MTDELRLTRMIDAPPDVVFEAFTSKGGQKAFYGTDEPGWIVRSECDLRVGGLWTVTFGPSPDHLYHHRGVFEIVDRPRRLVLATTEHRPDRPSFDFSVEVTFEEEDGRTRMTIIQSGFPTAELRDEHGRGVPNAFDQLEHVVRARGPARPLPDRRQRLRVLDGRFVLERVTDAQEFALQADALAVVSGPDGRTRMRRDDTAADAWVALWNGDQAHDPEATGMLSAIVAPLAAGELPVWVASSYDGDLILVPADRTDEAVDALRHAGHLVTR